LLQGAAIYVDDDGFNKAKGVQFDEVELGIQGITGLLIGTVFHRRVPRVPAELMEKMLEIKFIESF
jgi:hypothetical protein